MSNARSLPEDVARAYLELLGLEPGRGGVGREELALLQRAHVERVPYETVEIVLGRPPGIDPRASARRVVAGRGGYCYHLNGAFSALLEWLGVDVTRHLAGVQRRGADGPRGADGNHMGLTVRLPDGTRWLVDVGLGNGPREPLPLAAGVHEQGGFRYGLGPSACCDGWRFEHDPRGSFMGFDVDERPAEIHEYAAMHRTLSTESHFARLVTVQRWAGERIDALRGCVLTELTAEGERSRDISSGTEWWDCVTSHFGLAYDDLSDDERSSLWRRTREYHEAWDANGRP